MLDKANVKYEILNFDPNNGSLLIKYFTDDVPEGLRFNIDVPIIDGKFADEDAVQAMIEQMKPTPQLERIVASSTVEIPSYLTQHISDNPTYR
jgi:hypothetical protein